MSTETAQQEIIEEFSLLDDWMDRYQYLIELGRQLPQLDASEKTDDRLLDGCQSQVWLIAKGNAERLEFRANSDAVIVSGLIALLLKGESGRSAAEARGWQPPCTHEIGPSRHLAPARANGRNAMLGESSRQAKMALARASAGH